jgi:hypothetical protein
VTDGSGTVIVSFTVPADRYFAVTSVELAVGEVLVNGQPSDSGGLRVLNAGNPDKNGTRVVFPPGTLLTASYSGRIYLWGYLEPVR